MADDLPADRRRRQRLLRQLGPSIADARIAAAMEAVPRHYFVPELLRSQAYDNAALPIGSGQTISQPQVIVLMLQALALAPGQRVLDVGTGSGYAAALLAYLVAEGGVVHSTEYHEQLLQQAHEPLRQVASQTTLAPYHLQHSPEQLGCPRNAPFDRIHVACAAEQVPPALCQQLAPGGRMVCPVHDGPQSQRLLLICKDAQGHVQQEEDLGGVLFVPLLGGAEPRAAQSSALGAPASRRHPKKDTLGCIF